MVKIKKLKLADSLIGMHVPPSENGHAGRAVENILESMGMPINRKHGPDVLQWQLEIKTRDLDATSPQTIADMTLDEIVATPYEQSHVCEKFQQQLRVYIKDNVIVKAQVYDFSQDHVQRKIKDAYENGRAQLTKNSNLTATSSRGHYFGYFEKSANKNTYSFRMSARNYTGMENMSTSTFAQLIEL